MNDRLNKLCLVMGFAIEFAGYGVVWHFSSWQIALGVALCVWGYGAKK